MNTRNQTFGLITFAVLAAAAIASPFGGTAPSIPGLIEAENYDEGPAGTAYHDVDPENQGADYRGATQVDIEKRPDASNGHGVGWTRTGEWLNYTVSIKESGEYAIEFPVASQKKGGTFHLEIAGRDVTGPIEVPDTGGWTKLKTIRKEGVKLEKGEVVLRMVMDSQGPSGSIGDIDHMRFIKVK